MPHPIHDSYWNITAERPDYAPLAGGASADIAIIGTGMVGITLAETLKRAGRTVAVIEARRVGAQATGRSTAKLSALHGTMYADITETHGPQAAAAYARANQDALEYVAQQVADGGIDCALQRAAAYTYSETGESIRLLRREAEAARAAGLAVEYLDEAPLPFATAGALRLADQIQFHPQRYLAGLGARVDGDGSHIFEHTRALSIEEGNPCRVLTDRGSVTAGRVVLATHLPFLDRGLFFAKTFPRQHVALAARVAADLAPDGMFLCSDSGGFSVRTYHDQAVPLVIATDRGQRPGHGDVAQRYQRLETHLRERYGASEVVARWSNEDYVSVDHLPFVGRMPGAERIYLATGFSGWGLSNGTAAARLLADILLGQQNPLAASWRAGRWTLRQRGRELLSGNLHSLREMIFDRINSLQAQPARDLARGEGGLARHNGRLVAAYRDQSGELRTYSPYCSHLRCVLAWNGADGLWECPCHGSRFDHEGRVVHGPARRDLRRYD